MPPLKNDINPVTSRESKILEGLRGSDIFKHLNEAQLQELIHHADFISYPHSNIIVAEGDPGDRLYIIIQGIVKVKKEVPNHADKVLAYLLPGNTFGELGILENKPRSATVETLTEVDVLCFEREAFVGLLYRYPSIAIELAKLLGHYLTESNKRLAQGGRDKKVVFIIDKFGIPDATDLARQFAIKLRHLNERNTVLAEYPGMSPGKQDAITFGSNGRISQEEGIDILKAFTSESQSNTMKLALYIDHLMNHYDNLVVLLKSEFAKNPGTAPHSADQVILLSTVEKAHWDEVCHHYKRLLSEMHGNTSQVLTVMMNHSNRTPDIFPPADLEILLNQDSKYRSIRNTAKNKVVTSFSRAATYLADRLHRDNQVGILVPTVSHEGLPTDYDTYVEAALHFLGKRFGGATCEEVKGVWNSPNTGLIGEKVYKIHTYASATDLRKYMGEIVNFVRNIKVEMKQEAMALEINHKLTLL